MIQTQASLPIPFVKAMTGKTMLRQNRQHVPVELDVRGRPGGREQRYGRRHDGEPGGGGSLAASGTSSISP